MHTSIVLSLAFGALVHALPTPSSSLQAQQCSIPQYVLDHAPLLWLDTSELWFPGDVAGHLTHVYPTVNQTAITNPPTPLTLSNLDALNAYGNNGAYVYLHSNEGITTYNTTPWFHGTKPSSGSTPGTTGSAIITVAKPNNTLDVFYFYFYSFNQGNFVFDLPTLEFGDHVGDWEHTAIRFDTSTSPPTPVSMWFSQHSSGQAFSFSALEKDSSGTRPFVYVGRGTHANYAIAGNHDHTLSDGINGVAGALVDHTSQGTLWDPRLNTFAYAFDGATGAFTAYDGSPTQWLNFNGQWGDPQLPDSAPGQVDLLGARKFVGGPTGPKDKDLGRANICPDGESCLVRPILTP